MTPAYLDVTHNCCQPRIYHHPKNQVLDETGLSKLTVCSPPGYGWGIFSHRPELETFQLPLVQLESASTDHRP